MSMRTTTTANRLSASALTGVLANEWVQLTGWAKHAGTSHTGLQPTFFYYGLSTANTQNYLGCVLSATPQFGIGSKSGAEVETFVLDMAWTDNVWNFVSVALSPAVGGTGNRWRYINGSEGSASTQTMGSNASAMDEVAITRMGGAQPLFDGWTAEFAIFKPTGLVQAKAIADAMWNSGANFRTANNPTVTAIATPLYYWPILGGETATIGGINLVITGTPPFDTVDHPAVLATDPAPGGDFQIVCVMG